MIFRSPHPTIEIPEISLTEFIFQSASARKEQPALIHGLSGRTLRYGELVPMISRTAAGLAQHGVKKGDVFALYCPNSPEYAIAFHAVASLGGVNTLINPLYTDEELAYQLADSGARYLLTTPENADRALEVSSRCSVREVFVLGRAEGATPFASLMECDAPAPKVPIDPKSDLVALPYSSGTTGMPKGVMLTHYNLVANLCQMEVPEPITTEDTLIAVLPFFHIYGLSVILSLGLYQGATIVTLPRFEMESFLQAVERYQVTRAYLVPPILQALARHPMVERFDLSRLRVLLSAAAPLSGEVARACAGRLGCVVKQAYGMTEASPASHFQTDTPGPMGSESVGSCVPNTECRVVDPQTGAQLGQGQPGEIWVRGPQVMKGYLHRPDATAATVDAAGWLHTGDVGFVDPEGELHLVDRLKELIKYKGYPVAPAELESLLLSHPAIADAAVVPSPDEDAGEVPKAFVILRTAATADEIMAFVSARVAPYKKVRRVEVVTEIPRSPSGKILRRVLVEREREGAKPPPSALHPLSYGQQALWVLQQMAPESPAYNTMVPPVRIRGGLDVPALRRAFQTLIDRHAVLRTAFPVIDGRPMQRVQPFLDVPFGEIDAAAWSEEGLTERLVAEYRRPFDLERGPTLRVLLFHRTPAEHVLLLVIHHIAIDFQSAAILLVELCALYPAEVGGKPSPLPQPTHQYTDVATAEAERLAGPEGERLWRYWQEQLAGELPALPLPLDRPRPPVRSNNGATHSFRLDAGLTRSLRTMAHDRGSTLYRILLAAFQTLLYRYTGHEEFLVGCPVADRRQPGWAEIVGYMVNTVPLRADLSGDPTFDALLDRIERTVRGAVEHHAYPFSLLVQRLQPQREPGRAPLIDAAFNMLPKPRRPGEEVIYQLLVAADGATAQLADLQLEPLALPQQEGQFDLGLQIFEGDAELCAALKYSTDLFDPATIARMAGHLGVLLEGIVADPTQPVSALPLLTAPERRQLLFDWNADRRSYPDDVGVHRLFEDQAERSPDSVAVRMGDEQWTYEALNRRANQLAHRLRSLGVTRDTPVAVCTERSPELVLGILGIHKAGAAYLAIDPSYPAERIALMVSEAGAPVVLTQSHLSDRLPPTTATLLSLDDTDLDRESEANPHADVRGEDLAYLIYTSGSTGQPKGVLISHRGLCNLVVTQQEVFGLRPGDRVLQFVSPSFDVFASDLFTTLAAGATLCLAPAERLLPGPGLCRVLREERITAVALPASVLTALPEEELPELRTLIVGGEVCPAETLAHWGAGRRLFNAYGPTEATICATIEEYRAGEPLTLGRPLPNTEIYLLDPSGQPVPVGVTGEISIGGAGLARGYLNRPDLTQAAFVPHPFSDNPEARLYRTGDLARYLPDGRIEFLGRRDRQVKLRGLRIELEEIEALLRRRPDVCEAAVLARADHPERPTLVAYVQPAATPGPSPRELRRYLEERLPAPMVPSAYSLLEAFPRTPGGKLDLRALPLPDEAVTVEGQGPIGPRDAIERQLVGIWEACVGSRPSGVTDHFFDAGGDSFTAAWLLARVEEQFGSEISFSSFLQAPTIEGLAARLRRRDEPGPLVPIWASGSRQPLFCVHALDGAVTCYEGLARYLDADQPIYGVQRSHDGREEREEPRIEALAEQYLKAIRTVQPEGPYALLGYSFGGLVAFEIARQLDASGERVSTLALLDTLAPLGLSGIVESDNEHLRAAWRYQPSTGSGPSAYSGPVCLFRATDPAAAERWRELPPTVSEFVRTRSQDPVLGWQPFAASPVEVHPARGDHFSMLREPNVASIAKQLTLCLEGALRGEKRDDC